MGSTPIPDDIGIAQLEEQQKQRRFESGSDLKTDSSGGKSASFLMRKKKYTAS